MRYFLFLLTLFCSTSYAEIGYVYSADLNGDGVDDSIESGPAWMFGSGGGPFIISLSDGAGGFKAWDISMHPMAASLDIIEGKPRIWTYWRSSCCGGTLSVTTLDDNFETQSVGLNFSEDPSSSSVSRDIYNSIFSKERRIHFTVLNDYDPPAPLRGGWGK